MEEGLIHFQTVRMGRALCVVSCMIAARKAKTSPKLCRDWKHTQKGLVQLTPADLQP